MKDIFIGVDGGGTNCRLAICTQDGDVLHQASLRASGDISIYPEATWQNFLTLFKDAAQHMQHSANIHILDKSQYRLHIGFGVAGYSAVESRKKFIDLIEQSALFASYKIDNDVMAAYWDAHHGNPGGIIIIGTGSIGIRYENQKAVARFGGMGFPHDNKGSVAWLGMQLIERLLTMCGKLLKNVGQEVNIEEALTASDEPGAKLFLALLNHPKYYSLNQPATFKKNVYLRGRNGDISVYFCQPAHAGIVCEIRWFYFRYHARSIFFSRSPTYSHYHTRSREIDTSCCR